MRGSSAARRRPLLACLDGVTDPHNLGAVCRSAEGAGASGVIVPGAQLGKGDGRPSAGRRREPSSTCLVAVVVNLARCYLGEVKRADLWAWAAAEAAEQAVWEADLFGRHGARLRRRRQGRSAGRPQGLRRRLRRSRSRVGVESLNVSVAAGIVLFDAARQRARSRLMPGPAYRVETSRLVLRCWSAQRRAAARSGHPRQPRPPAPVDAVGRRGAAAPRRAGRAAARGSAASSTWARTSSTGSSIATRAACSGAAGLHVRSGPVDPVRSATGSTPTTSDNGPRHRGSRGR